MLYSVPFQKSQEEKETDIFRHPNSLSGLLKCEDEKVDTIQKHLLNIKQKFAQRSYLGTKGPNGKFFFKSYEECISKAELFGSGLIKFGLCPERREYKDYCLRFLAVYSKNREE